MAVIIANIKAQLQTDIEAANTASRQATDVDGAMDIYNEKMALAISNAFETFLTTATVIGVCPPNGGPLTQGMIE